MDASEYCSYPVGDCVCAPEVRAEAFEQAAQLCEAFIRDFRGMAEDGDHFDTLPAKIRALKG